MVHLNLVILHKEGLVAIQ